MPFLENKPWNLGMLFSQLYVNLTLGLAYTRLFVPSLTIELCSQGGCKDRPTDLSQNQCFPECITWRLFCAHGLKETRMRRFDRTDQCNCDATRTMCQLLSGRKPLPAHQPTDAALNTGVKEYRSPGQDESKLTSV